ncbi:MAG TPA: hypothetical protein VI756_10330 [Blastocatellia bacterium]
MRRKNHLFGIALILTFVCLGTAFGQSSNGSTDPTLPGPFAVSTAIYNLGETALTFPGFPGPVEFEGSVHYPTNLSGPPHPLLVFLHGRHGVCFQGTSEGAFAWPCPAGQEPIPSFEGYDYLAQNLASYGYIVVSISANGINAADAGVADAGALARAELIQTHLNLWDTLNTTGGPPFGTLFVGKVDMTRVGTMGHSRGGEGVVRHFQYNQSLGSPYKIKAVFAIAPIDFNHEVINDVPLAVILPYCDGDVLTLEGVHFYDDSRYNVPGDQTEKHTVLVMGANHDYFNTIWTPSIFPAGSSDDWGFTSDSFCGTVPGNGRLTPAQQEETALVYVPSFFRTHVGGEAQFLPLQAGAVSAPATATPSKIHVTYQAPDNPSLRLDVNRFLTSSSLTSNGLGGAITPTGMTPYSLCGATGEAYPCVVGLNQGQQPHTDSLVGIGQLSELITGWGPNSTYVYTIPPGQGDVKFYQALQFRAAVNLADVRNAVGVPQNLSVTLTDASGKTASVVVNAAAPGVLFFPPGNAPGSPVPRNILNMVRIPMSSFFASGLNLTAIRQVEFKFNQTAAGGVLITDVAFTNPPIN